MQQSDFSRDPETGAKVRTTKGKARGRRRLVPKPMLWILPGFIGTARVKTSFGDLPLQALRANDPLCTVRGPLAKVARVDTIHLDEQFLTSNPDALPVRIPAGAFGQGRPMTDLLVSPHQKINVSPGQFRQDFRMARDLIDRPGVARQPVPTVTYHAFHCATPAAVLVEGLCVGVSP